MLSYFYKHLQEMARDVRFMRVILMKDDASIHILRITTNYHAYNRIMRIPWSTYSPDLNLIENVWRLLKY